MYIDVYVHLIKPAHSIYQKNKKEKERKPAHLVSVLNFQ